MPDSATGAVDEHLLARADLALVTDDLDGDHPARRQGRGLRERQPLRLGLEQRLVGGDVLSQRPPLRHWFWVTVAPTTASPTWNRSVPWPSSVPNLATQ